MSSDPILRGNQLGSHIVEAELDLDDRTIRLVAVVTFTEQSPTGTSWEPVTIAAVSTPDVEDPSVVIPSVSSWVNRDRFTEDPILSEVSSVVTDELGRYFTLRVLGHELTPQELIEALVRIVNRRDTVAL